MFDSLRSVNLQVASALSVPELTPMIIYLFCGHHKNIHFAEKIQGYTKFPFE